VYEGLETLGGGERGVVVSEGQLVVVCAGISRTGSD
jgi:hypothetical protein